LTRHLVTLNSGSSSIKFSLYEADGGLNALAIGLIEMVGPGGRLVVRDGAGAITHEEHWDEPLGPSFHTCAFQRVLAWRQAAFPDINVVAAGHRVVHGGMKFSEPVIISDSVVEELKAFVPLAPLHQPHNLAGIRGAREAWPHLTQVACFDTAFHFGHAFVHQTYALPRTLYDEGVRRYGFHGLSYEYIARRLREIAPLLAEGRVIAAHLGNGASMCAMRGGRSIASTMGFSALDGLPMGTRSGQLDPAVVLYLIQQKGMEPQAVADMLYRQSGLRGISGFSNDMRELLASARPEATQALEYFVARIRHETGALAADLKGVDALTFSGGIGEHAWQVRERVLEGMEWLGVSLDRAANRANAPQISSEQSRVKVFIVPADEEGMIARHTLDLLERMGKPND
jgi:acetate kinase